MRKIGIVIGAVVVFGCLLGSSTVFAMMCHGGHSEGEHEEKSEKKESGKKIETKESFYSTLYVCPMCPDMQYEKPGKCPKCGMKLEKKQVLMTYACPEKDCEYRKAKPGKCPHHDKDLVKCEMKTHCPKCGEQVESKELKLTPVKP
ncbi:MAG: heavy metal-binding domain-containing protein [Elusimicrobiota bacterium]|nr:heavy metal-binding domain-containing protein [Elusimicrobiota bacterium]